MNIVLVHGFYDSGRIFWRMKRLLSAHGHQCFAPSLRPMDAWRGIPDLAEKLADYVAREVSGPTALVGFSMGALVCRYYLQALGGMEAMQAFFAISGPHCGTWAAWLYPGKGAAQMRPGNTFLKSLNDSAPELCSRLPVYSYWTPMDLMIVPATSCRMPSSRLVTVWCPIHALMPLSGRIVAHMAQELAQIESGNDAQVTSYSPRRES